MNEAYNCFGWESRDLRSKARYTFCSSFSQKLDRDLAKLKGDILLPLCFIFAMTIAACEGDTVTLGPAVEGIQVIGTGSATGEPDVAVLDLGIAAMESHIDEAQDAAMYAMQRVLDSIKSDGVFENDIQTQQFSIRPVYQYVNNQRVLQGYEITNTVIAKLRDIGKSGEVIDHAVTAGGKWIRVNSIKFAIDDPKPLQEKARAEAMKDADNKAQALAELGGVTLGKPTSISESVDGYGFDSSKEAAEVATPIEPGELEVTVTLLVVYDIE